MLIQSSSNMLFFSHPQEHHSKLVKHLNEAQIKIPTSNLLFILFIYLLITLTGWYAHNIPRANSSFCKIPRSTTKTLLLSLSLKKQHWRASGWSTRDLAVSLGLLELRLRSAPGSWVLVVTPTCMGCMYLHSTCAIYAGSQSSSLLHEEWVQHPSSLLFLLTWLFGPLVVSKLEWKKWYS